MDEGPIIECSELFKNPASEHTQKLFGQALHHAQGRRLAPAARVLE